MFYVVNMNFRGKFMKKIIALNHQYKRMEDIIIIDWGVSNICNYQCSYCPKHSHEGTFPFVDIEKILLFSNRINKYYKDKLNKEVYFLYTGGEVTLFKDFIKLIKMQKENGNKIGISSNGSKDLDFWQEAMAYLTHVSLSYHCEYTDIIHFVQVINLLKNHVTVNVNIMVHPEYFEKCIDAANIIYENTSEISLNIQIVLKDFIEPYHYSEKQKAIILKTSQKLDDNLKITRKRDIYRGLMKTTYNDGSFELIKAGDIFTKKLHSFKGWNCYIGLELLVIDLNGDIYRSWCHDCKKIGNIKEHDLQFPHQPHICSKDWCTGGITDIMITKKYIGSEV